uniref:Uncharacterized protein n=1 Tax=Parascaris equorum TaxID=6256 RepID=A0A914SEB4_PAREQ
MRSLRRCPDMFIRAWQSEIGRRSVGTAVSHSVNLEGQSAPPAVECNRKLWRIDGSNPFIEIPQCWVCSLDAIEEKRSGMIDLHPEVFRCTPRIDILHRNVTWQLVPSNLADACDSIPSFTIMPVYGLNCYSIMKYETIVLCRLALEVLEYRILFHKHRAESLQKKYRYADMKKKLLSEAENEIDATHVPYV